MSAPALSKKEWLARKRAIEEALKKGYSPPGTRGIHEIGAVRAAANALKVNPAVLQSSIHRAKQLKFPEVDWGKYKNKRTRDKVQEKTPDIIRSRNQISSLTKRLDEALKYAGQLEDIRKSVFNLLPDKLSIPNWQLKISRGDGGALEIPTLFTSDFQAGEVIRSNELDYPNDYSPQIFRERYRRLIKTSIKLLERESPGMKYPGIVYLRGGDAISGDIHQDLSETQDTVPTEQTQMVAEEEIKGLEELLKAVPRVTVYSVPGNHDRTTLKPRAKRFTQMSYDYLALWAIESYFKAKGEDRITFSSPPSGDAYYTLFNTNYLLTHGDRIGSRGGQGFIGPSAVIQRGIYKVRAQMARIGRPVDYVLTGHFHVAMQLPHGIANGCLAGFSEYAKSELRAEPEPPTQTMFWTHPKWGLTTIRRIRVDHD